MNDEESAFPLGSLVVVKRGRHAGSVFAVVGIESRPGTCERVMIADGGRISARKPKRKNTRHIVKSGVVASEVASRLAEGKRIDDGWLSEIVSRLKIEISRLILEEAGQSVCQKTMS